MFLGKQKKSNGETMTRSERVASEAEGFYRSGRMHCAEAVVMAIRNNFCPEVAESVVYLAAGFGGGSATGCLCGAVAGGTMAFGLVLRDDKKKIKMLTRELQTWFKQQYGAACCTVILQKHKNICPELTGRVAGKVAELLS